jgi:4-alpha-glucanotransferase
VARLAVHGAGYDVWRHRGRFATGMSAGAPPDTFFRGGQNWGFPPLLPGECLDDLRASVRAHLEHAGLLRVDHVMGLHRLYWIPDGLDAKEGLYVRYPAAELYAVLSIESHRAKAAIVGENLGTVPVEVTRQLGRRGLLGMHVTQFAMEAVPGAAVRPAPRGTMASLDTHDTPPFAAHWEGADIDLRERLGLLEPDDVQREHAARAGLRDAVLAFLRDRGRLAAGASETADVLAALLEELADGDAEVVLVNLEDLWLERHPQNVPGITDAYPSWRRRAERSLESIVAECAAAVRRLAARRAATGELV